jgi:cystathionine beta-lyase
MKESTSIINSLPVDPLTGAITVPIYQTSTFVQEAPGVNKGYDYARSNNPTRAALESMLAKLENGTVGLAFASGLAAIDAVIKLLSSGDEILAVDNIYGGTFRMFEKVYKRFGISVRYIDTTDIKNIQNAITSKTKLIWLESPTNPTLRISDIQKISIIAKKKKVLVCVDNTFATPILQKPLNLGADITLHSATKYLGGHSDVIAGAIVTKDAALGAELKFIQNATGAGLSPWDSWLIIRGLETLELRVKHISSSAIKVAKFLEKHPSIAEVHYPGLKSHPNHSLSKKQSKDFGGIISFSLKSDNLKKASKIVSSTKIFKLAESLGGIKSLISHPAQMTHKSIPEDHRRSIGIKDSLIRLSIGLEDVEDLIEDLNKILSK